MEFGRITGRVGLAVVLMVAAAGALAAPGSKREVLGKAESSLLVKGEIHIETDGSVSAVVLDRKRRLDPGIARFVHETASKWTFEPVQENGKPVSVRSPMAVNLVATVSQAGSVDIRVGGVNFSGPADDSDESIRRLRTAVPTYPPRAVAMGAEGIVYLLVQVSPDGKVTDVVAEQVNLTVVASSQQMQRMRELLTTASISAARRWTFLPPTSGPEADAPFWTVRVPAQFILNLQNDPERAGRWETYIPGPRQRAPWLVDQDAPGFSPDALSDGGLYMVGADKKAPKLLTPLGG